VRRTHSLFDDGAEPRGHRSDADWTIDRLLRPVVSGDYCLWFDPSYGHWYLSHVGYLEAKGRFRVVHPKALRLARQNHAKRVRERIEWATAALAWLRAPKTGVALSTRRMWSIVDALAGKTTHIDPARIAALRDLLADAE